MSDDLTDSVSIIEPLTLEIPEQYAGSRLDQVLAQLIPEYSRSRLATWIREGRVTLDGVVPRGRQKLAGGEEIILQPEPILDHSCEPEPMELNLVYEDEHLLVIDKPAGLVVHQAAGNWRGTLQNGLLNFAPELAAIPRAGIVHRLDKGTSGLLVIARTLIAHTSLVRQLQARTMGREYDAVVIGTLVAGGSIEAPIGRHAVDRKRMAIRDGGKPAVTHYRIAERFTAYTRLWVKLESGRTHQIRVHMASVHHPLIGDATYGGRFRIPKGAQPELVAALQQFGRPALHAAKLTLQHPVTEETLSFEAQTPCDYDALIELLRQGG